MGAWTHGNRNGWEKTQGTLHAWTGGEKQTFSANSGGTKTTEKKGVFSGAKNKVYWGEVVFGPEVP